MNIAIIIILVLEVLLVYSPALSADLPINVQNRIWADIVYSRKHPDQNRFDKFNAIEDIELIRKARDVSPKAAALATVLNFYDRNDPVWIDNDHDLEVMKSWIQKRQLSNEQARDFIRKHLAQANDVSGEMFQAAGRRGYTTLGVNVSRLMDQYLKDNNDDIIQTVEDFARKRGKEVEAFRRDGISFSSFIKIIDSGGPVIIQPYNTDSYLVCLGYAVKNSDEYIIVVNPVDVKYKEVSRSEAIKGTSEAGERMRQKLRELDSIAGLKKKDRVFVLNGQIEKGIKIMKWDPDMIVYYIGKFKSSERSIDKYYEYLRGK